MKHKVISLELLLVRNKANDNDAAAAVVEIGVSRKRRFGPLV